MRYIYLKYHNNPCASTLNIDGYSECALPVTEQTIKLFEYKLHVVQLWNDYW